MCKPRHFLCIVFSNMIHWLLSNKSRFSFLWLNIQWLFLIFYHAEIPTLLLMGLPGIPNLIDKQINKCLRIRWYKVLKIRLRKGLTRLFSYLKFWLKKKTVTAYPIDVNWVVNIAPLNCSFQQNEDKYSTSNKHKFLPQFTCNSSFVFRENELVIRDSGRTTQGATRKWGWE